MSQASTTAVRVCVWNEKNCLKATTTLKQHLIKNNSKAKGKISWKLSGVAGRLSI